MKSKVQEIDDGSPVKKETTSNIWPPLLVFFISVFDHNTVHQVLGKGERRLEKYLVLLSYKTSTVALSALAKSPPVSQLKCAL